MSEIETQIDLRRALAAASAGPDDSRMVLGLYLNPEASPLQLALDYDFDGRQYERLERRRRPDRKLGAQLRRHLAPYCPTKMEAVTNSQIPLRRVNQNSTRFGSWRSLRCVSPAHVDYGDRGAQDGSK